jgi:Na+/H+ antiporter NhaD/arsenite permease-like protein
MTQAATVLAMLVAVAVTVFATRLPRDDGLALVTGVAAGALALMYMLGADTTSAAAGLAPLLLIIGYAALAAVLTDAGVTRIVAGYMSTSPVGVLLVAAAASSVLSNDVVIVAMAPVVLLRRTRVVDAAALFVGANITGGLLPTGSPTNLMIFGDLGFFSYLGVSAPVTVAMVAAATAAFAVGWRLLPNSITARVDDDATPAEVDAPGDSPDWTTTRKALAALGLLAVASQPICSLLGVPRSVLGFALCMVAVVAAKAVGYRVGAVIAQAPWQIGPVVLVLAAGASLLAQSPATAMGSWQWGFLTFFVSAFGTDLLAAALAAPAVLAGYVAGPTVLVAVTAGAFVTPVASVSGILLLEEHQAMGLRTSAVSVVMAATVAVVCWAAGTAMAMALA